MKRTRNTPSPYGRAFFNETREGSVSSAEIAIPHLMKLINVTSAVDVGCGIGAWLKVLMANGVTDVWGIDGDYIDRNALEIPKEQFLPRDICRPLALDRRFDVALSLEVAEHLEAEYAEYFVSSLVKLAPVILFSAAIPFQTGTHHVNEQWPEYWAEIFKRHGYAPIDCMRPFLWNDPRVDWWYSQNAIIYANDEGLAKNPRLAECWKAARQTHLSIVHPSKYLSLVDPAIRGSLLQRAVRKVRRRFCVLTARTSLCGSISLKLR